MHFVKSSLKTVLYVLKKLQYILPRESCDDTSQNWGEITIVISLNIIYKIFMNINSN